MASIRIVLEGLTAFLMVFNPTLGWDIRTGNPLWQAVRWALPRSPIARIWVRTAAGSWAGGELDLIEPKVGRGSNDLAPTAQLATS